MKGVTIVKSPWVEEFREFLIGSDSLDFASPFIKKKAIQEIIENDKKVRGITVFSYPRFIRGASDIDAMEQLINHGADLRSLGDLHAKIYIFDNAAIVTSANLTTRGLGYNTEYGLVVSNDDLLDNIKKDFDNMLKESSKIQNQWIYSAKKVIDKISPEQRTFSQEFEREVPPSEIVIDFLSGWMKDVYSVVLHLDDDIFDLKTMYSYTNHFSEKHPENKHIKAKIRQTLQYLRNIGLVEFIDNQGNYRRL